MPSVTRGRQSRTIRPSLVAIPYFLQLVDDLRVHGDDARIVAARRAIRAFQQSGIARALDCRNRVAIVELRHVLAAKSGGAVFPEGAVRAISAAEFAASINVSVLRSSELAKPADSPTTTRTPTPSVTPYVASWTRPSWSR